MVARYGCGMCLLFLARIASGNNGYELLGIGPISESLSGAGAASPQDATWTLRNPASITALRSRLDVSFELLVPRRTMDATGPIGIPVVNKFAGRQEDDTPVPIPGWAMIWPLESGTLGFGMLGWGGTGIDYKASRTTIGALQGHADRRGHYLIAKIPVAYAHEFDNGWSLGLALHLDWQRLRTDTLSLRLRAAQADNAWDDTIGAGLQVGVYKKWERLALGATYGTRNWTIPFDDYEDLLEYRLDLPATFQAGVSYEVSDGVEFLLDYRWINYADIKQLSAKTTTGGLGWTDQHLVKAGVIWNADGRWTFRAGASYGEDPIPSDQVFVNAGFPGIADLHASFGFTYAVNERSEVHFVYSHAFAREETESGKGDIFSKIGKGTKIGLEENAYGVGYTYKF